MIIGVETTDIVHSTKLDKASFSLISDSIDDELNDNREVFNYNFQRFRGDAYQVCYSAPEHTVRASLLTRLAVFTTLPDKSVLLTQSIIIGKQDVSDTMGEVFIASGRQLDKQKRAGYTVEFINSHITMALPSQFLQTLLNGLTRKQADTLYWYIKLGFPEHQMIADKLKMSRQNVNTHLQRANSELVKAFIDTYERNIQSLLHKNDEILKEDTK